MESEFRPIPAETNSDTPEYIQECFELKKAIDGHVDDWYEQAISFHPGHAGRFSTVINADCTPIEQPIEDMLSTYSSEKHLSQEDQYFLRQKLERQKVLSTPANDPSLDTYEIENPRAALGFANIRTVRDYPHSNSAFVQAYDHLYRLYAKREHIAHTLGDLDTFDTSNMFSHILNRVFEDRHLGNNQAS